MEEVIKKRGHRLVWRDDVFAYKYLECILCGESWKNHIYYAVHPSDVKQDCPSALTGKQLAHEQRILKSLRKLYHLET